LWNCRLNKLRNCNTDLRNWTTAMPQLSVIDVFVIFFSETFRLSFRLWSVCQFPPLCLSVCLPLCLSACLSLPPPAARRLTACMSVCPAFLSVRLPACLSVHLCVCLPVSLSVCLPVCLSVCLSACLPVSLSAVGLLCLPTRYLPVCLLKLQQSANFCLFATIGNRQLEIRNLKFL
jgi:hypothetical protein